MNIQIEMFPGQKQLEEQRKLLQTLIDLKAAQIQENEFKNFFGTVEEIRIKQIEVDKKLRTLRKGFIDHSLGFLGSCKGVLFMKHRKRRAKWYLLYRREDGQAVYRYEPLRKCELNSRIRKGWKVVQ